MNVHFHWLHFVNLLCTLTSQRNSFVIFLHYISIQMVQKATNNFHVQRLGVDPDAGEKSQLEIEGLKDGLYEGDCVSGEDSHVV